MYKKIMAGIALTAALTAIGAAAVSADGALKVNTRGIAFEIPEELSGLVTVDENDPDQNTIVSVYETASVEAAKAQGREDSGAGWIFSITAIPEARMRELRCGGMDGMSVFAEDDDLYYVYETPTDVRFVREQYEDIEEDQKQFTALNEWAGQEVRQEILYLRQVNSGNAFADVFRRVVEFPVAGPLFLHAFDVCGDAVGGFDQGVIITGFLLHVRGEGGLHIFRQEGEQPVG